MKDDYKVDVILPVFNGSKTIHASLISVLNQKGHWINKIIVINDGSTDNTLQIVKQLNNSLIHLYNTDNRGVSSARNFGVEKSTAEWIAFIDADDLWEFEKIDLQLKIARNNNVNFICSSVDNRIKIRSHLISPWSLIRGNFIATSSVLVKRDVLLSIQPPFSRNMSFAEDYLTWLKCLAITSGYYESSKLVSYTLSDYPRYKMHQILKNLYYLNLEYRSYIYQQNFSLKKKFQLSIIVNISCILSLLSIFKRFILIKEDRKF